MSFTDWMHKHHMLLMIAGCVLPLVIIAVMAYFWGLQNVYLYWFVFLLCPIMHLLMMSSHKEHGKNKGGKCH